MVLSKVSIHIPKEDNLVANIIKLAEVMPLSQQIQNLIFEKAIRFAQLIHEPTVVSEIITKAHAKDLAALRSSFIPDFDLLEEVQNNQLKNVLQILSVDETVNLEKIFYCLKEALENRCLEIFLVLERHLPSDIIMSQVCTALRSEAITYAATRKKTSMIELLLEGGRKIEPNAAGFVAFILSREKNFRLIEPIFQSINLEEIDKCKAWMVFYACSQNQQSLKKLFLGNENFSDFPDVESSLLQKLFSIEDRLDQQKLMNDALDCLKQMQCLDLVSEFLKGS